MACRHIAETSRRCNKRNAVFSVRVERVLCFQQVRPMTCVRIAETSRRSNKRNAVFDVRVEHVLCFREPVTCGRPGVNLLRHAGINGKRSLACVA